MKILRYSLVLGAAIAVLGASAAQAQSVVVEGQVQVQQQPVQQGYGQPPPGYGQQQVYVQPQYAPYPPQQAPVYAPPQQPRVQYVDQETSIKGLWIPGIIVFGVSFVLTGTMAAAFAPGSEYSEWAWIPLVGPWIMLSVEGINDDEIAGAVLGGITQLAGVTMFILGLALRTTERVAVYSFDERDERSPRIALDIHPTMAGATVGFTLSHF